MSRVRKTYTEEFQREAVAMVEKSGNKRRVARDLGVDYSVLKRWQKQRETNPDRPFPGKGNPQDQELALLKSENARLKEEVEILKKAVGIFSNRPR
jgi:transposase